MSKTPLRLYVIHAKTLSLRMSMIDKLIAKLKDSGRFDVTVEIIDQHDPTELDPNIIQKMVNLAKSPQPNFFDMFLKNMHIKQLSNALKHRTAFEKIANSDFDGISLVLEDDVIHGEDVAEKLESIVKYADSKRSDWDVIYLGLPQPINADPKDIPFIRPTTDLYRVVPCIESYLLHKEGATKLSNGFSTIRFITNVNMSYVASLSNEFKSMMATNNVFVDGTKYGAFVSTLDANNKLFLNTDYVRLVQILENGKEEMTDKEVQEVNRVLSTMRFQNHPDVMTLNAVSKQKQKKYDEAKSLFEKAHEIYKTNDSILNNESEFLLRYTRIFKYFQDKQQN